MKTKYISPFKPKKINDVKTSGLKIYTFNIGYKKFNDDLLVIVFEKLVELAAVFTKSSTPSAPVIWNKEQYKSNLCKVLIVNSGNANAYTGKIGIASIKKYSSFASQIFNCKLNQVFVSSTGVIGEQLNPNSIITKLKLINNIQPKNLIHAAKAIMTTDTYPKVAVETVRINGKKFRIYGIAKGSGMIYPNMGTMLAFIFTDAKIPRKVLKKTLSNGVQKSFNSISVDGDTSTSDTVFFTATGEQNHKKITSFNNSHYSQFQKEFDNLLLDLALQIVKDGEGAKKLITISVKNAKNYKSAKHVGFSIANSLLVKTTLGSKELNFGRIFMAIGKSYELINQDKVSFSIGNFPIVKEGKLLDKIKTTKIKNYMKSKNLLLSVSLNNGKESATVYTCDLTHKYIDINTNYLT